MKREVMAGVVIALVGAAILAVVAFAGCGGIEEAAPALPAHAAPAVSTSTATASACGATASATATGGQTNAAVSISCAPDAGADVTPECVTAADCPDLCGEPSQGRWGECACIGGVCRLP